jgi:hypothetical protein
MLGNFFTNSSGHPVHNWRKNRKKIVDVSSDEFRPHRAFTKYEKAFAGIETIVKKIF